MTKQDVLALLEQADAPVSGEQLCKALGVTRAAVWKAIEALRSDGYDIEAATRRGYRLRTKPLTKQALDEKLKDVSWRERIIVLPEVDGRTRPAGKKLSVRVRRAVSELSAAPEGSGLAASASDRAGGALRVQCRPADDRDAGRDQVAKRPRLKREKALRHSDRAFDVA